MIIAPTTPFLRVESSCRDILFGARATSCETSERGYQYGTESTTHWRCVATFRGLSFSSPLFFPRCQYCIVSFFLDFLWLRSVANSTGGKTGFRNKFSFAHSFVMDIAKTFLINTFLAAILYGNSCYYIYILFLGN